MDKNQEEKYLNSLSKEIYIYIYFFILPGSKPPHPAEPPGGLGVGARGAGAGERGLKASQALQRPTRAYRNIFKKTKLAQK